MNLGELKAEIFSRLDENSGAPVFFAAADIALALNQGLEDLADRTEYYEVTQSINKTALTTYYNLLALCTKEPLSVVAVWNSQTERWLTPVAVSELDEATYRYWERISGEPEKYILRGLYKLGLFPKPTATSGTVVVTHSAIPARMSADEDTPADLPEEFTPALIEYAMFDLLVQDGEIDEALAHYKEYLTYVGRLKTWAQRRSNDRTGVISG